MRKLMRSYHIILFVVGLIIGGVGVVAVMAEAPPKPTCEQQLTILQNQLKLSQQYGMSLLQDRETSRVQLVNEQAKNDELTAQLKILQDILKGKEKP